MKLAGFESSEVRYLVVSGKHMDCDTEECSSFGIAVKYDGKTYITFGDMNVKFELAKKIADTCNYYRVSAVHAKDILDDILAGLQYSPDAV